MRIFGEENVLRTIGVWTAFFINCVQAWEQYLYLSWLIVFSVFRLYLLWSSITLSGLGKNQKVPQTALTLSRRWTRCANWLLQPCLCFFSSYWRLDSKYGRPRWAEAAACDASGSDQCSACASWRTPVPWPLSALMLHVNQIVFISNGLPLMVCRTFGRHALATWRKSNAVAPRCITVYCPFLGIMLRSRLIKKWFAVMAVTSVARSADWAVISTVT